jgi:hypothetical protein
MLTEEKALEIARYLKEHKGEQGLAPTISHALKVSGKEINKVSKMIEKGLLAFSEEGEPYFITPFKQIEKYYLSTKEMEPEEIAHKTVVDTVQGAIAEEAATQSQQYIILGKAVWQAYANYAVKKGLTIDDIRQTPIHQEIIKALEKTDKYEETAEENKLLRQQLQYLQGETDPMVRLKNTLKKTTDILTTLAILDQAGFNIEPLIPFYERMIQGYLTGGTYA